MSTLTLVLLGLFVLVAAFIAYVAARPSDFRIGPVTNVTWAMTGCSGFVHKLFGVFFSMDKIVGGEFAKGLATLKSLVETNAAPAQA